MKLKKGDKVRFLNDIGGGIVTKIIDQKMVEILNEDDFEIPVMAIDLVKVSDFEKNAFQEEKSIDEDEEFDFKKAREEAHWGRVEIEEEVEEIEEEIEPENSIQYIEGNDELNLYAALVPEDSDQITESAMSLYIINDSNFQAHAMAFELDYDDAQMIWNQNLDSNSKIKIKTYQRAELGQFPKIRFQFLMYRFGKFPATEPLQKDMTISPIKFYKTTSFTENDYFDKNSLIVKLNDVDLASEMDKISDEEFKKLKQEKSTADRFANTLKDKFNVSKSNSGIQEIDLHIHELVDNHKSLSNAEMLNVQMEKFHSELALGLKNNDVKKMVFIHGVGAGTLKQELRKSLTKDYPQLYFQDASFKEYGFGATLIIIRRG